MRPLKYDWKPGPVPRPPERRPPRPRREPRPFRGFLLAVIALTLLGTLFWAATGDIWMRYVWNVL